MSEYNLLSRNIKGKKFQLAGGVFVFQQSLIKPIENILMEYEDLTNGLTFINKKTVYPSVCENFWRNGYTSFIEYQQTVKRIVDKLFPTLLLDKKDNYDDIIKYSRLIVNATKNILKDYKKGRTLIPPTKEKYLEKHHNFLRIYNNIFEEWKNLVKTFNDQMETPNNEGEIFLMYDFTETNNALDEIKKEIGYILGIKTSFWDLSLKEKIGTAFILLITAAIVIPIIILFVFLLGIFFI